MSATAALEEGELEEDGSGVIERDISICGAPLASFACHPTRRAILALTVSGEH